MSRPFPIPVFMYHHVEPLPLEPEPLHGDSYVPRKRFAEHLDRLREWGYATLTLGDAVERWSTGAELPRRPVVLTFDDGCRCFAEHAWPELQSRGMTATLFAVAGQLGGTNAWDLETEDPAERERREDLLDAEAFAALAREGVEVACHGHDHIDLRGASAHRLDHELTAAKERLEEITGRRVTSFCYPYGHLDEAAAAAVRDAGYRAAVGIREGTHRDRLLALPRFVIRPGDSDFELRLKATGAYRWWRRLPRLGLLATLRRWTSRENRRET
ncbi:MAG: polysaccharide deacetylase family protein [Acidobacteriota bacterium]|nr:polysaccharide deacetylase family protein [Acidobacteriota bacterium]